MFRSLDPLISGGTVRKRLLLLTIAVLCLGTFASADTFITSGSRTSGFTTDAIDWGQLGAPGTLVTTPALVTSLGGTNFALAGNINGSQFVNGAGRHKLDRQLRLWREPGLDRQLQLRLWWSGPV